MLLATLLEKNLVDRKKHLVSIRELRSHRLTENATFEYQAYLAQLTLAQVNLEIDFLLNEIDLSYYDQEAFWKLDSVMQYLEHRSSSGAARLIRKIREEVYSKVRDVYRLA